MAKNSVKAVRCRAVRLFVRFFLAGAIAAFCLLFIRFHPYIVLSGSMEPALKTGSVVFVDTGRKEAGAGDIITYSLPAVSGKALVVTHRVVRKEGEYYVTKGDANDCEDPVFVHPGQVIGRFAFAVPYVGRLIYTLQQLLRGNK